ncbi:MAG: hypothetical protein JNK79_12555 [Chitinophagaceae bacterium]|nr:hypothetical protein [Chitinophagaceae bacterium]
MRFKILFALILISTSVSAQTLSVDSVQPSTTDVAINEYNFRHYVYRSSGPAKNELVVFIPGTFRQPNNYLYMMEQIALLGYHVIGIGYKYDPAVNPLCRTTGDVTCHWRARMETIDGTDRHPGVSVNAANSILNRLLKALQFFANKYPTGGWGQYFSGSQLQWNKIIVSGHSQGASLAGIMGKEFPVKKVVMWSVMDYLNNGSIPDWVNNTNNHDKFYAFIHPKDEQVPFMRAQIGWDKLGMTQHGSMVAADCNVYPFNNTHILYTSYVPSTALVDKYHNGTTLDIYIQGETAYKAILAEAIRYLYKE